MGLHSDKDHSTVLETVRSLSAAPVSDDELFAASQIASSIAWQMSRSLVVDARNNLRRLNSSAMYRRVKYILLLQYNHEKLESLFEGLETPEFWTQLKHNETRVV